MNFLQGTCAELIIWWEITRCGSSCSNLVSDAGKGYSFAGKPVCGNFGLFWTLKQLIINTREKGNQLSYEFQCLNRVFSCCSLASWVGDSHKLISATVSFERFLKKFVKFAVLFSKKRKIILSWVWGRPRGRGLKYVVNPSRFSARFSARCLTKVLKN